MCNREVNHISYNAVTWLLLGWVTVIGQVNQMGM